MCMVVLSRVLGNICGGFRESKRLILAEWEKIGQDCRKLGIVFKENEEVAVEEACGLVRGD